MISIAIKNQQSPIILSFDQEISAELWQECQKFSTPGNCLNAYINQIAQTTILPYLQNSYPEANIYKNQECFWELGINGSTINLEQNGTKRLIIIPTENILKKELYINAEWIDIPDLIADYYLFVQIDLEEEVLQISGYTTHTEIKQKGTYLERERSYSFNTEYLIKALYFLGLEKTINDQELTRSSVNSLPLLSRESAKNYLTRLRSKLFPRRELNFETWIALLQNQEWRNNLYRLRLGIPQEWSILNWIQNGIPPSAEQFGWTLLNLNRQGAISKNVSQLTSESENKSFCIANQYTILGQNYELQIKIESDNEGNICTFTLTNLAVGGLIPAGFKLRLLTDDLQSFPDNEVKVENPQSELEIKVYLDEGEKLICEIEPYPDNYHRQIFKF